MANYLQAIQRFFADSFGNVRLADDQLSSVGKNISGKVCAETTRGTERWTAGATGVADTREICLKNAANVYAWMPFAGSLNDEQFAIYDDVTPTKRFQFEASLISASTTRTANFPNKDGTLAFTSDLALYARRRVPFLIYNGKTITDWINQPAANTEFGGVIYFRKQVDLTGMTEFRLWGEVFTVGAVNAILWLEYSVNAGGAWAACNNAAADQINIGTTGHKGLTWRTLATGARTDVLLRVIGASGDGVADPFLTNLVAEFK